VGTLTAPGQWSIVPVTWPGESVAFVLSVTYDSPGQVN
jgi:hypothetical protein